MSSELDHTKPQREAARALTSARISLGITGQSVPTREHLRFQLDHALARDAVHTQLDVAALRRELSRRNLESLTVSSAAAESQKRDRGSYLRRPDLGRTLSSESRGMLEDHAAAIASPPDLCFVLADGLSALAIERHALPVLDAISSLGPWPRTLGSVPLGPVVIATAARVGLGDEIGQALRARLAVVLIGERPGLSSPDSLGVYITWQPRPGRTDAERNCISNIRSEGLSYATAAARIRSLLSEARRLQTTGILLKEDTTPLTRQLQ